MINRITNAINKIRKDDDIRAVVITVAGKGFCAGADMAIFRDIIPEEKKDKNRAQKDDFLAKEKSLNQFIKRKRPVGGSGINSEPNLLGSTP